LACGSQPESATRPYLHYAAQSAAWLRSVAVQTDGGLAWPDDALRPQEIGLGIGEGVAGKVLFFLGLHDATGEEEYLAVARAGADYLLATMPEGSDDLNSARTGTSMYTGVASVGFTLNEVFKRTGTERYQRGALDAVRLIHDHAASDSEGVWWSVYNDLLFGNAGTGLFLLYAAREFQHDPSRELAIAAGLKLLSRGVPDRDGLTWKFREDREFILPNFSHGAAGIGYFLATLSRDTGRQEFLDAALASARYLEAVAKTDGGVFLVPYGWPNAAWSQAYDIGWAHGPAGTARFFYRLWQITDDPGWLERVHQSARGILASGLLDGPVGGDFGDEPFRIDRRFDLGGVAEFLLDLYSVTDTQEYLDVARTLVEHIATRAAHHANGIHWPMPRYDFMEDGGAPAEFTGYFYGAAGLGLLMLQLDALDQGTHRAMPLPDNPFVH
jgi:lantibiotic modifying enzyme